MISVFVPGHHPRFETYMNPFPCHIASPYAICIWEKKQYAYCTKLSPMPKSEWEFWFKHTLAALATAAPPPAVAEAATDGEAMVLDMTAETEAVNGAYNNQPKDSDSGRNDG
jgi:hypothetical protein